MRSKNLSVKIPTAGAILDCFECNSWEDPRCHDPFNYSIYKEEMPETKACEGCCVKMVQFIGTGKGYKKKYRPTRNIKKPVSNLI